MIPPEAVVALAVLACVIGAVGALVAGLGSVVLGGPRGTAITASRGLAIRLMAVLWVAALIGAIVLTRI